MEHRITRRGALRLVGGGLLLGTVRPGRAAAVAPHALPPLGYAFDALEPTIDARTMEIHHGKHHAAYVNNLNTALADQPALAARPLEQLLADLEAVPEAIRVAVRNNGGGHANHTLFWRLMTPGGATEPKGKLAAALTQAFGSLDEFKTRFGAAAATRFGSGWAWLALGGGQLKVYSTANQDSPLMVGDVPLLGLDVWEHAYYLQYQNRRADYIKAWWAVVNWDVVGQLYDAAV